MAKWIIAIVVVVAGAIFLFAYSQNNSPDVSPSPSASASGPSETISPSATPTSSVSPTATPTTVTVTYTDSGYSPATVTIPVGGKVIFKNNSSAGMWTASAMHPTHKVYPGSDITLCGTQLLKPIFDECKSDAPGASWEFTFTEKGQWGYHNHSKSSHFGKVVVQ